ncbi:MAG: cation:proton antiporter [Abditibacteriales bacterium]|nr:cation:proton antiporter [Abditibacteriales bacterium]MDW8367652.1 cation:proton antiporter [Abditibacteriales bacterium]
MSGYFPLAIHLFLQLTIILAVCRIVGRLLRPLRQTQVVSEMVAGVLLGPSLLGLLAPDVQNFLFPRGASMSILYALSQVGLTLYMFLIGLELNRGLLVQHSRDAVVVSLSGVLTPMVMGGALGAAIGGNDQLFTEGIATWQAALFVASAMSITAFPMLARILYESGMAQTKIGTLAISAAAFDDASAWCLLACVLATVKGSFAIAALAIGGGAAYALFMVLVGRRWFRWFDRVTRRDDGVRGETLAVLLLVLMLCAWFTDLIGIYSVFGAFVCGVVMPRGLFAQEVRRMIEPLTVSLLLPIFFVYSGLNTRIQLLVEPSLLGITVATIVIAFLCKGGGCGVASRWVGAPWRDAATIGVLMNARGLMELILVNIALEKGLITHGLFTILVLMAIITTLAASPLFHWIYGRQKESALAPRTASESGSSSFGAGL